VLPQHADASEAAQQNTGLTPQEGAVEIFWFHAGGIKQMFEKWKAAFLSMSVLLLPLKQDELEHLEALVTDFLEISPREGSDNMPFFYDRS